MAQRRRRKQKSRNRATGQNNPVHHEAAPEQTTTEASPTSAAQNPKTPQAYQPAPKAGPRQDSAITDPEPTTTSTTAPGGSMVEVKDKPDWEITPYRPPTVTRAKTRMQLGEWEQLAELDGNEVISGAPITELQLMAAVGHLQKGGESARDRARTLLLEAMDAGADRKQIARMLIAGASNTLGRLAALTGRSEQKVLEHFRSAIAISDPEADVDLMLHAMAARQLMRLARKTGSKSIQEMAQRAALGVAFAESETAGQPASTPKTANGPNVHIAHQWSMQRLTFRDNSIHDLKTHASRDQIHDYWRTSQQNPSKYANTGKQRSLRLVQLVKQYTGRGRILEIGTNAGRNLHYLYSEGFTNLEGIEISPIAVASLRETFPDLADVAIHVGAIEDCIVKFPDKSFDCVFTMAVLEHIHYDSDWIFAQIARIARCIITIEDELRSDERHFPRNYERVFAEYGMHQVHLEGRENFGLPTGFTARVFKDRLSRRS